MWEGYALATKGEGRAAGWTNKLSITFAWTGEEKIRNNAGITLWKKPIRHKTQGSSDLIQVINRR